MILQAVECEALTRSKIMYQAILNFKQVTSYTALLADEGLLTYLDQDRKYAITDKGKQFLRLFKETNKLLTTSIDEMEAGNIEPNVQQHEVTLHK
ncbi:MAG: winged helix-turn-helix domain-containing protein [Thermoproteota archaeon]|nr:winged helix-turn-helix domain-containing protein [Thermoproteota archaeon]